MDPLYRPILKKAFHLSLRNKWLWVLGFFAAFIGNGGVYEALLRSFNNLSENRSIFYTMQEYSQMGVFGMLSWAKLRMLWITDMSAFSVSLFTILLLLCVLALLICFGVIGQAGLIRGVIEIDEGKKTNFKKSFHVGVERFWPVLELNVITKVILLGLLLMLAYFASLLVFQNESLNLFIYILAFIVFIVLGIIIYFLTIYGTAYVVLRNKGAFTALASAWHLFRQHVLLNLEMGLVLFIINIVVAILFFVSAFILISPFVLLYFLFIMGSAKIALTVISIIVIFLFILFLIFAGAWYGTFQLTVWATLFEELALNGGKSKTQRIYESIRGRLVRRRKK